MADNTKIEWADATANYVNGCTRVSPGCGGPGLHGGCYAERLAGTRLRNHPSRAGTTRPTADGPRWTGEIVCNPDVLTTVLRWKRPRRIFWNAHGDLFHPNVPDELIDRQWAVMALTPQHTHMVLTKRPERMREYLDDPRTHERRDDQVRAINRARGGGPCTPWAIYYGKPLPNVWLGTSVENQHYADDRIPHLLATPAAVRFLSCEPLLGPIDLRRIMEAGANECFRHPKTAGHLNCLTGWCWGEDLIDDRWECWLGNGSPGAQGSSPRGTHGAIDWVIVGGESGANARPMHPDWARSLRDQCAAASVPFFFKQWGEWKPSYSPARVGDSWPIDNPKWCAIDQTGHRCAEGWPMQRTGKKYAGHLLDAAEHLAFPEVRA